MFRNLKKRLYFVVASYFAFWARLVLRRWQPRIIVITGSSGKTTILHLVEARLGNKAIYTHHANSAIGIPFHILGMEPNIYSRWQWFSRLLVAPFKAFRKVPPVKLYIVEADNDRPNEGKFLANLLKPEAVLWVSVFRTHSANFDSLVGAGKFATHEQAIAHEFGYFVEQARKFIAVNGDQQDLTNQLERAPKDVQIFRADSAQVTGHTIQPEKTEFVIGNKNILLPGLHPKDIGVSLMLVEALIDYLGEAAGGYEMLELPPGRCSVFKGKKDTVLIDSSYNTGLGANTAVLNLFEQYPNRHKWLVLGDILEQGSVEAEEHKKLGDLVGSLHLEHVILVGPRTHAHTYPVLQQRLPNVPLVSFEGPKEVLDYMEANLKGGEAVLFKGGRFLEGAIEQLLLNPEDGAKLPRREAVWVKRRQQWGLSR